MKNIKYWIDELNLQPLDGEGGYYKEIIRDTRRTEDRSYYSIIYYLLENKFHTWIKMKNDEIWNIHAGSAVTVHMISPDGQYSNIIVGKDLANSENLCFSIPHDHYYFITVNDKSINYCLATCTVALGFEFSDRECISNEDLIRKFPKLKTKIIL